VKPLWPFVPFELTEGGISVFYEISSVAVASWMEKSVKTSERTWIDLMGL